MHRLTYHGIYAHILDEDRKSTQQKFETAFLTNPDMRPVERSLRERRLRAHRTL